jgi:hypothetical protein
MKKPLSRIANDTERLFLWAKNEIEHTDEMALGF